MRSLLSPDRLVSVITIVSAVYAVVTFTFEVGFFWNIGLVYMSAFPLGDHVTHAGALALASAGAALLYMSVQASSLVAEWAPGPSGQPKIAVAPEGASSPPIPSKWRKWLKVSLLVGLVAAAVYALVWPDLLAFGPAPGNVWMLFAAALALTVIAGVSGREEERQGAERLAIFLLLILIALGPAALGDWYYRGFGSPSVRSVSVKVGSERLDGVPVFVGSNRMILGTERALYLLSEDGTFVLKIR